MFGDGDDGGEVLRGRDVFEGGEGPCGDGGGDAAGLGKEGGGAGGGGAEDDAREGAVEVGAGVVGGVPGELGAEGEAVEGGGGHVEVAVVAPVGVEEAARAVLVSGAGVGGDDGAGFFHGVEDLSESAHGWADDGGEVALGEGVAFGEVVGGKVGPVEDGGVVGESANERASTVNPGSSGSAGKRPAFDSRLVCTPRSISSLKLATPSALAGI